MRRRGLQTDADDLEPELRAHPLQERDVASAPPAEMEVGTDDGCLNVSGFDQSLVYEQSQFNSISYRDRHILRRTISGFIGRKNTEFASQRAEAAL